MFCYFYCGVYILFIDSQKITCCFLKKVILFQAMDEISFNLGELDLTSEDFLLDEVDGNEQLSRLVGKPTVWFRNRSDTNRAVQAQKQARSLKFRI